MHFCLFPEKNRLVRTKTGSGSSSSLCL